MERLLVVVGRRNPPIVPEDAAIGGRLPRAGGQRAQPAAVARGATGHGDLGERDGIIPVDHAYAAHEARTDARLEVLPDVGHFAQVEAPMRVVELIEDFIATDERRDATSPQPG